MHISSAEASRQMAQQDVIEGIFRPKQMVRCFGPGREGRRRKRS